MLKIEKQVLRAQLRQQRRQLPAEIRLSETAVCNEIIWQYLKQYPQRPIASYMAVADELALDAVHDQLWAHGKIIYFPRVLPDHALSWHALSNNSLFISGTYGIREPDPTRVPAVPLPADTLILVPGIGFTRTGQRLGQGKGYYDRLLATHQGPTIGIGFSCQLCDHLPSEAHDHPVNGVILGPRIAVLPP
jgi:5-formyltetrahydrofolate cyclo-ligase